MEGKICSRCGTFKPLGEFNKRARARDGKQTWCRDCNRRRSSRYYRENRDYHVQYILASRKRRRRLLNQRIDAIKGANGCALCPENDPVCLEFHHIDPRTKRFAIGTDKRIGWKWATILAEIKKCAVLCANCHKKVHVGKLKVRKCMACNLSLPAECHDLCGTVA